MKKSATTPSAKPHASQVPGQQKKRKKNARRTQLQRDRMQAYFESAKFVERQCEALVAANAAAAAAAREEEEGGGAGRGVVRLGEIVHA